MSLQLGFLQEQARPFLRYNDKFEKTMKYACGRIISIVPDITFVMVRWKSYTEDQTLVGRSHALRRQQRLHSILASFPKRVKHACCVRESIVKKMAEAAYHLKKTKRPALIIIIKVLQSCQLGLQLSEVVFLGLR